MEISGLLRKWLNLWVKNVDFVWLENAFYNKNKQIFFDNGFIN